MNIVLGIMVFAVLAVLIGLGSFVERGVTRHNRKVK